MMLLKWLFDRVVSFVGMILLFWLYIIVAILIKIKMPGPVLFVQERVGRYGRLIKVHKFRSMRVKEAGDIDTGVAAAEVNRITPLGEKLRKYKLDELPELFNILKGDMSLIGPRPERPQFVEKFKEEIPRYMIKHQVRPGLTGWAQVNGRNTLTFTKQFEYDVYYVDHLTFWLDVKIFFMTIFKVFKREGISEEGQATREAFNGYN